MSPLKYITVLILWFFSIASAKSQPYKYSNLRSKKISASVSVILDGLSIVPNTFFVRGFDTPFYNIDEVNAKLHWKKSLPTDSVEILYRVFPYKLNAVTKRYSYDSILNNFIARPNVPNRNNKQLNSGSLFDFGTMNYNGSFARALSFGNTQDVVVCNRSCHMNAIC